MATGKTRNGRSASPRKPIRKAVIKPAKKPVRKAAPKEIEWIDLDDEEYVEYENSVYDDYEESENDYADDYVDEEDAYSDVSGRVYRTEYRNEDSYSEDSYDEISYNEDSYSDDSYEEDYNGEYEEDYNDEYAYRAENDYRNDDYDDNEYYDDETGIAAIWHKIQDWFYDRTTMDFVMMGGAVLVLVMFVVIGSVFFSSWLGEGKATEQLADLGTDIEDMEMIIGKSGLIAAADAKEAEREALVQAEIDAMLAEEAAKEAEEEAAALAAAEAEAKKTVVVLNLTSIQKDLKIKFVNNATGKLIKGIEFVVKITDPKGKTTEKTNTDKDGIIYLKNIAGGKYSVSLIGPENDDLSFLKDPISITVKDTIEYKKVDVADEIKSEKEINAAQEDTAKNDTAQEGALTDTVEWVESSKTLIEGTEETGAKYEAIPKTDVADPGVASIKVVLLSKKYDEDEPTPTPEPSEEPGEPGEDPSGEEPGGNSGEEPGGNSGEEPGGNSGEEPGGNSGEPKPIPTPTPEEKPTTAPSPTDTPAPEATPTPTPIPTVTPSATPTITPTPTTSKEEAAKNDTTSTLKDKKGNVLYIKDGDSYKEAHFADYYKYDTFFVKTETKSGGKYKYTGWQNIDGYTYYYTSDGNYVTGEQVIQGAKYNFSSDGRLSTGSGVLGIDVSKWNGSIDWNAVRNSGVSFVIIRCGYRGSTVGGLVEDPLFKSYINGAANAGLKVGVYFFSQAINEVEAVEEASTVLSLIKGYNVPYGVYLDMETSGGRADGIGADMRTKVAQAFCKTIANSGYKAGVYANKTWFTSYINTPNISNYKIWLAQYAAAPTYTRTRYDIWQYSSKGSVGGIKGNVDMDISYLGY